MRNDFIIEQFLLDENYRVASNGDIFTRVSGQGHITNEWRLKPAISNSGRYTYTSYLGKKLFTHRIVYSAFVGPLIDPLVINHKDGRPWNNDFSNLEQITESENMYHSFRHNGQRARGGRRKLTYEIADQMREDALMLGLNNGQLRDKYGVSKATVSYVLNNAIWR